MFKDKIYRGPANIYLEGQNSLEPTTNCNGHMEYYIGCSVSDMVVKDYRLNVAQMAQETLANPYSSHTIFSAYFNSLSWIVISRNQNLIEIKITDKTIKKNIQVPTLWLGVVNDGSREAYNVEWEIIKSISSNIMAFIALVG